MHEGDHYALVPNRSLIEIEGPDTAKFLQGLITNHMPLIATGGNGFYTAFLSPQVRNPRHFVVLSNLIEKRVTDDTTTGQTSL